MPKKQSMERQEAAIKKINDFVDLLTNRVNYLNRQTDHRLKEKLKQEIQSMELVMDNFPPEAINFYKMLQDEIAVQLPIEEDRPTIVLNIRGSKVIGKDATLTLIGGTGPLSDSNAICEVIEKIHHEKEDYLQYVSITLISDPPPRMEGDASKGNKIWHTVDYFKRLLKTINHSGREVYLVSNTAHANASTVNKLKLFFQELNEKKVILSIWLSILLKSQELTQQVKSPF